MPDPSRLAVAPSVLADAAARLAALDRTLAATGTHSRGPRPAPAVGDVPCSVAYQNAAHQTAGLVTTAVEQSGALTRSLGAAAVLYGVLDGARLRGSR